MGERERSQVTVNMDGTSVTISARYSAIQETWNTVTHGIGLVLSVGGLAALVTLASLNGSALHIISCAVYGASLVGLYAASTFYHAARNPRWKSAFRVLDHCAIYVLIAGTYTPFTLLVIQGGWGWALFGLVWGMALLGLLGKIFLAHRFPAASLVTYLVMGWLAVIAIKPVLDTTPTGALVWLLVGGLAYTGGTIFYSAKTLPYGHVVWHLFVLAGSLCHYLAVFLFVVPEA